MKGFIDCLFFRSLPPRRQSSALGTRAGASTVFWIAAVALSGVLTGCGGSGGGGDGGGASTASGAAVPPASTEDVQATVDASGTASWPALAETSSYTRDLTTCLVAGSSALKADLVRPKQSLHLRRAVMFVHGGSWSSGSKSDYEYLMRELVLEGYTGLSVDYRLSPAVKHPTHLRDVACQLRWLRANAARLDIDPDRIAVIGGSAGAHLSALLAFDRSNGVHAAILHGGPYDLRPERLANASASSDALNALFGTRSPTLAQLEEASPVLHVKKDGPPVLILHGRLDPLVPVEQAASLALAMTAVSEPYWLQVIEGAGHADFGPAPEVAGQAITGFLATQVR